MPIEKMAAIRCAKFRYKDILSQFQTQIHLKVCTRPGSSFADKRRNLQALGIYTLNDPIDQDKDDINRVYRISVKDMKGVFAHGFPTRKANRHIDFTDYHMIIRKPVLEVLKSIKKMKEGEKPPRFVIYGDDGTGKSIALSHVIHLCAQLKWLILHVPSVNAFTQSNSNIEQSTWKPGRIDQPEYSSAWLKAFRTVNQSAIENISTTKEYKLGRQDGIPEGSPIVRVVEQGMARMNFATDAIGIILKEIQKKENLKVLYAVDDFNSFFTSTSIRNKDKEYYSPQELSLVHHFTQLFEPERSLKEGCYALALSRKRSFKQYVKSIEIADQVGRDGMSLLGDHVPVLIENFNTAELHNYLLLLKQNFLLHKEITEKFETELKFLTDGNPSDVVRLVKGE